MRDIRNSEKQKIMTRNYIEKIKELDEKLKKEQIQLAKTVRKIDLAYNYL